MVSVTIQIYVYVTPDGKAPHATTAASIISGRTAHICARYATHTEHVLLVLTAPANAMTDGQELSATLFIVPPAVYMESVRDHIPVPATKIGRVLYVQTPSALLHVRMEIALHPTCAIAMRAGADWLVMFVIRSILEVSVSMIVRIAMNTDPAIPALMALVLAIQAGRAFYAIVLSAEHPVLLMQHVLRPVGANAMKVTLAMAMIAV